MTRPVICALGVCHRDVDLAATWLRWVSFLCTQEGGDNSEFVLLVTYTKRAVRFLDTLNRAFGRHERAFITHAVQLPNEDESGYPRSSSHLFLRTLEIAEKMFPGHAVMWCEADTVAMKPTWFRELAGEYQTCGKPFMAMKVGQHTPHMSGNGLYPHNWREVAPTIATVLKAPDAQWGEGKGQPWDIWCRKETTAQMAVTRLMWQVWKDRGVHATPLHQIPAEACLFHQDKTGALIRELTATRYPGFMNNISSGRRFYKMMGHPSRLRAKGAPIHFSYTKFRHGWVSALCDTEISESDAQQMAMMIGKFGITEISELEFSALTGRAIETIPTARRNGKNGRTLAPARAVTHPRATNRALPIAPTPAPAQVTHQSVFVMLGRYGDIMNILPMLKAEADAGRRPTLFVAQEFQSILDGVSYVDRIVWEGAYDQLPEALRWLRRSKGIAMPIICQYHRHPFDKARLTDSYMKECWRLAGRLDQFDGRGPLIFDRRNEEREAELKAKFLKGVSDEGGLILYAGDSVSSPFSARIEVLNALRKSCGNVATILDIGRMRAARVFDMVDVLDRASLLVTVDTMHLHLARASKVPIVAILNENWRGSVPPANTLASVRYSEANRNPQGIADVVKAHLSGDKIWDNEFDLPHVEAPQPNDPPTFEIGGTDMHEVGPSTFHVVDTFGSEDRHHVAQSTWTPLYNAGVVPIHCSVERGDFGRNAKTALGDPRPLPFLKDLLQEALARSGDINDTIFWSNSDIGLGAGFAESVNAHLVNFSIGACSMRRTESNGHGHQGRDMFAFKSGWLRQNWDELPDYVLGAPAFDLGLVAMLRNHAGCEIPTTLKNIAQDFGPADMPPGLVLHQSHKSEWHVPNHHLHPSVRWNKKLFVEWAKQYAPGTKFSKGGNLL